MPEIETTAEFDAQCDDCGLDLDVGIETDYRGNTIVKVTPCPDCLEKEKNAGDNEGYERGFDAAKKEADDAN